MQRLPSDIVGLSKVMPRAASSFALSSSPVQLMISRRPSACSATAVQLSTQSPQLTHGFHADYRPSYRKDAAQDAWNQMTRWFKKYGVLS